MKNDILEERERLCERVAIILSNDAEIGVMPARVLGTVLLSVGARILAADVGPQAASQVSAFLALSLQREQAELDQRTVN